MVRFLSVYDIELKKKICINIDYIEFISPGAEEGCSVIRIADLNRNYFIVVAKSYDDLMESLGVINKE